MLLEYQLDIVERHLAVPDHLRIDDNRHALSALPKAASRVDAHDAFEACIDGQLLQTGSNLGRSSCRAAPLGIGRISQVFTDKHMSLVGCHAAIIGDYGAWMIAVLACGFWKKARNYQMASQTIENVAKSIETAKKNLAGSADLDPAKVKTLKKRVKRAQRKHLCMTNLESRRAAQLKKKKAEPAADDAADAS
jgi:hypothetical protein